MAYLPRLQPRRLDILPPLQVLEVMARSRRPGEVDLVEMVESVRPIAIGDELAQRQNDHRQCCEGQTPHD